jgi:transposase
MKSFREYVPEQALLLPESLDDWLPAGHLARFVSDVVEELDLAAVYGAYEKDGRGQSAYHPLMLSKVLIYGYATGKLASRKLERACQEEVPYRYLSANQQPDHDTIATFRRRHLRALGGLFVEVLHLCQKAGLVKLGHVAIDGTKMKANASRSKTKGYEKLGEEERQLRQQVEQILAEAEAADRADDEKYGKGRRGDELPQELADRESRLKKIREAKAALEREAREEAERKREEAEEAAAERQARAEQQGRKLGGRPPRPLDPELGKPKATTAGNTTDPDSRLLKCTGGKGFLQGYNAQAAVDQEHQVVVAAEVVQDRHDRAQLNPMLEQVRANTGRMPQTASADTGYYSPRQVRKAESKGVDLYVKPAKPPKHNPQVPESARKRTIAARLRQKLETEQGRAIYGKRRETVEPVFGQIKECRGIRAFLLRGLGKVRSEWRLICLAHNLRKLWRSGWTPSMSPAAP